jgi:hypothetical protein
MPGQKGRSGRKRKPTAQHIADGTYQKCRHENRADNVPADGWPEKPGGLSPMQEKLWDDVTTCLPSQCLGKIDTAGLRDMVRLYGIYCDLISLVEQDPSDSSTVNTMCKVFDRFWKYAQDYGLTAVARSRLDAPIENRDDAMDALHQLLESRN